MPAWPPLKSGSTGRKWFTPRFNTRFKVAVPGGSDPATSATGQATLFSGKSGVYVGGPATFLTGPASFIGGPATFKAGLAGQAGREGGGRRQPGAIRLA